MKTTPMRTNESAAGSTRLLHRLIDDYFQLECPSK